MRLMFGGTTLLVQKDLQKVLQLEIVCTEGSDRRAATSLSLGHGLSDPSPNSETRAPYLPFRSSRSHHPPLSTTLHTLQSPGGSFGLIA